MSEILLPCAFAENCKQEHCPLTTGEPCSCYITTEGLRDLEENELNEEQRQEVQEYNKECLASLNRSQKETLRVTAR
jgi:hypothetical protein